MSKTMMMVINSAMEKNTEPMNLRRMYVSIIPHCKLVLQSRMVTTSRLRCYFFRYSSRKRKNSRCQTMAFCGFTTKCVSSGK